MIIINFFSFPQYSKNVDKCEIISYDELINFEVIEDGNSIVSGGLGKALVGGAIFGLGGAIAGGTSKKVKNFCSSLKVKITTSNEYTPIIYITLIDVNVNKNSSLYQSKSKIVEEILSYFQIIISKSEKMQDVISQSKEVSVTDEIKKYKELLDMNAITLEEYNKKKKELLNKKI